MSKSPDILDNQREFVKTGTAWLGGCNSVRLPWVLPDAQFIWGVNVVNRGGIVQTRPGYICRLTLPAGNLQGCHFFRVTQNLVTPIDYLVFAVDGLVYAIPFPLVQPKDWSIYQLANIQFSKSAKNVYWADTQQSATENNLGELQILPTFSILVMQDGVTNPAYWDGTTSAHSNPNNTPVPGIPIGTWMSFSGNRLWVASQNQVYASDIGNPLQFLETIQGTARGTIQFFQQITGLVNAIGINRESVLYVFTQDQTFAIQSGISDRTTWATTVDFKVVLFPSIGCIAGRSVVNHVGLLWWYSAGGLVSSDSAAAAYLTSQVKFKDIEMARSKRNFAPDISNICGASFESYLLMSVPSGDFLNAHTMALDYSVADELNQDLANPAWQGVWTGIRPIEWATGTVDGTHRIFAASVDYASLPGETSFNHIWEGFQANRMDSYSTIDLNNSPIQVDNQIYCSFETKKYGDTMDLKKMAYAEIDLIEMGGNVNLLVSYAGTKGSYYEILRKKMNAQLDDSNTSSQEVHNIFDAIGSFRPQGRRLWTGVALISDQCQSVESQYDNTRDKAFSLYFQWCGRMGIECFRIFTQVVPEKSTGGCEEDETSINIATYSGQTFKIEQ
jgi:hypothetical protein